MQLTPIPSVQSPWHGRTHVLLRATSRPERERAEGGTPGSFQDHLVSGAEFVLTVKQNQPGLFAALAALPWASTAGRPDLKTYRKSSPGAPQAVVDVALGPAGCSLAGSERLVADSRPIGRGLLWGPTETQTETSPRRTASRAARRTGVPAGQRCGSGGIRTPGPSRTLAFKVQRRSAVGRSRAGQPVRRRSRSSNAVASGCGQR